MMFAGSRHCPHCGAAAAAASTVDLSILKCPRCKIDMASIKLGAETLRECETCGGLWVEVAEFEKICASREEQAAVLGGASPAPDHRLHGENAVRYVPCPQCAQLMNRINFARCSGVIVDICKGHGTWFDRDELSEIIQFIRSGGLEASRQREKQQIEMERQQLRADEQVAASRKFMHYSTEDDERIGGLSAAGGLLRFLID
jgi:Zn-finger nucleic acid-binding protein